MARVGRARTGQVCGVALLAGAALLVLGERGLRPGGVVSLLLLATALGAALLGIVLASRSAPLLLPTGTVQDAGAIGELALAAVRSGGDDRDALLDVLCGALAYQCTVAPQAWDEGDLGALKALLSRCDASHADDARLIEAALGFFAVHGGPRELELARWLSTGTGGSPMEAGIREAAASCAARMEETIAGERLAGRLVRPADAPAGALLRPAASAPGDDAALLRPAEHGGD